MQSAHARTLALPRQYEAQHQEQFHHHRHSNMHAKHLHKVAVAAHEQAGVSVVLALLPGEVPLEQRLVPRARDKHVHGVLIGVGGESDGGNPSVVANEGSDLLGGVRRRQR